MPDGPAHISRINASGTGQFESTLIVADDDAYVSYLGGMHSPDAR